MRRIDADKIKAESRVLCDSCTLRGTEKCTDVCVVNLICKRVDLQPTVEERSYAMGYQDGAEDGLQGIRTPGRWVYRNDNPLIPSGYYECNVCEIGKSLTEQNYCGYCGADMRGEEE